MVGLENPKNQLGGIVSLFETQLQCQKAGYEVGSSSASYVGGRTRSWDTTEVNAYSVSIGH